MEVPSQVSNLQGDLLSTTGRLLPLLAPLPPTYTQSDKTGKFKRNIAKSYRVFFNCSAQKMMYQALRRF